MEEAQFLRHKAMITDILQVCKVSDLSAMDKGHTRGNGWGHQNGCPVTGELFLALVFASESALIQICHELYIKVPKK